MENFKIALKIALEKGAYKAVFTEGQLPCLYGNEGDDTLTNQPIVQKILLTQLFSSFFPKDLENIKLQKPVKGPLKVIDVGNLNLLGISQSPMSLSVYFPPDGEVNFNKDWEKLFQAQANKEYSLEKEPINQIEITTPPPPPTEHKKESDSIPNNIVTPSSTPSRIFQKEEKLKLSSIHPEDSFQNTEKINSEKKYGNGTLVPPPIDTIPPKINRPSKIPPIPNSPPLVGNQNQISDPTNFSVDIKNQDSANPPEPLSTTSDPNINFAYSDSPKNIKTEPKNEFSSSNSSWEPEIKVYPENNQSHQNTEDSLNLNVSQMEPKKININKEQLIDIFNWMIKSSIDKVYINSGKFLKIEQGGIFSSTDLTLNFSECIKFIKSICPKKSTSQIDQQKNQLFSYQSTSREIFHINTLWENNSIFITINSIKAPKNQKELMIPELIKSFSKLRQGLFIISGANGSGKSTTAHYFLDHINKNFSRNIISIEEPKEVHHLDQKSLIRQCEINRNNNDSIEIIKFLPKSNCNILMVDIQLESSFLEKLIETINSGVFVILVVPGITSAEAISNLTTLVSIDKKNHFTKSILKHLKGFINQTMLPINKDEKIPLFEVMETNSNFKRIMDYKLTEKSLLNAIQTNKSNSNLSLDQSILNLVNIGAVTPDQLLESFYDTDLIYKLLSENGMIGPNKRQSIKKIY